MCLKSDTLLLADVFENFGKMCIKIYEWDPTKFLSTRRLAWHAILKKTKVKLELLTDIDMLVIVKLEVEYFIQFTDIQMLMTRLWKIMIILKNNLILNFESK